MEVSLAPDEHKTLDIDMAAVDREPDGVLVVVPLTEERSILPGVKITLQKGNEFAELVFDTDATKSFKGDPGEYTLHAEYPGFQSVRRTVTMKDKRQCNTQEMLEPVVVVMQKL